jgi:hypothetical protein
MDKAAEVAVLGAVANNPHLSTQQLKIILEFLKQAYMVFLNLISHYYHISFTPGTVDFQYNVDFCQWT